MLAVILTAGKPRPLLGNTHRMPGNQLNKSSQKRPVSSRSSSEGMQCNAFLGTPVSQQQCVSPKSGPHHPDTHHIPFFVLELYFLGLSIKKRQQNEVCLQRLLPPEIQMPWNMEMGGTKRSTKSASGQIKSVPLKGTPKPGAPMRNKIQRGTKGFYRALGADKNP